MKALTMDLATLQERLERFLAVEEMDVYEAADEGTTLAGECRDRFRILIADMGIIVQAYGASVERIAKLEEALKPISACADAFDLLSPRHRDDDAVYCWHVTGADGEPLYRGLTVGHLRDARTAFAKPDGGGTSTARDAMPALLADNAVMAERIAKLEAELTSIHREACGLRDGLRGWKDMADRADARAKCFEEHGAIVAAVSDALDELAPDACGTLAERVRAALAKPDGGDE